MSIWSQLNLEKMLSKYQSIEQQKNRPTIFKQKKRKFEQIYKPLLPQIQIFSQECSCQNKLTQCDRLKSILKKSNIQKAEQIYQHLKLQRINKFCHSQKNFQYLQINSVLKPHFLNLQQILNIKQPLPLLQILKHAKTQYLTFWIYGLFCSHWPTKQSYIKNINYLVKKHNFDLNFQLSHYQNQFDFDYENDQFIQSYNKKLSNLYKDSNNYITILRLICKQKIQMLVEKLTICMLVKGRNRSQKQAINASLQM